MSGRTRKIRDIAQLEEEYMSNGLQMGDDTELTVALVMALVEAFGDDQGNISKESFDKICNALVKSILLGMKIPSRISEILKQFLSRMGYEPESSFYTDFEAKILALSKNAFPVVYNAVFRFFDADRSGSISTEEARACVRTVFLFTDGRLRDIPISDRARVVAESFFRVFDANGNGVIEVSEVHEIISDIISGLVSALISLIDHFEPVLVKEPLDFITKVFSKSLRDMLGGEGGEDPFQVDKLIEAVVGQLPAMVLEPTDETRQQLEQTLESSLDKMDQMAPNFRSRLGRIQECYDKFFQGFEQRATEGKLSKAACVDLGTDLLLEVYDNFNEVGVSALDNGVGQSLPQIDSALSSMSSMSPNLNSASMDRDLVKEVVLATVASLRFFIKGGGAKRLLTAVFNLLDINNDGVMSREELRTLADAIFDLVKQRLNPGVKDRLISVLKAAFALMDTDSDNQITQEELKAYYAKVLQFAFAYATFMINLWKQLVTGAMRPLLTALFHVKSQMLGGPAEGLALEDLDTLFDGLAKAEQDSKRTCME